MLKLSEIGEDLKGRTGHLPTRNMYSFLDSGKLITGKGKAIQT
jgi:hypothetical protein